MNQTIKLSNAIAVMTLFGLMTFWVGLSYKIQHETKKTIEESPYVALGDASPKTNPNDYHTGLNPPDEFASSKLDDITLNIPNFELSEMGMDRTDSDGFHTPYEQPTDDDSHLKSPRSSKWPSVRKAHLSKHPRCEACGSKELLAVHHIKPFHEFPELELDPSNLITLCFTHHIELGHKGNWKTINPYVREDAKQIKEHNLTTAP